MRHPAVRHHLTISVLVAAMLLLAACGRADPPKRLTIATGATGGVYAVYGAGLAQVVNSSLDGYQAGTVTTAGSVENLQRLADGKVQVAFTLGDQASDAALGRGRFRRPVPLLALGRLYVNYTQVVARAEAGIRSIADLKGRRVSVGANNSGTQVIAQRILQSAGIDPATDIQPRELGIAESAAALRAGQIDALFWSGGLPTKALTGLAKATKLVLLPTGDYVRPLQQRYGQVYTTATIRGGAYPGVQSPVLTIAVDNYLVVRRDMDEDLAYRLTRLLFQHQAELERAHPEARNLELIGAQEVTLLELHPGAARYYAEASG
jgi:TRAP transporter TAXI family solute receptor